MSKSIRSVLKGISSQIKKDKLEGDKLIDFFEQKLHISFVDIKNSLKKNLQDKSEKMIEEIGSICPYGDQFALIEDDQEMIKFLNEECSKEENWALESISIMEEKNLMLLSFDNKSMMEGSVLKSDVFLDYEGKLKHVHQYVE